LENVITLPGRDDEVGPWSENKLSAVGRYLKPYMKIMNRQRAWCQGGVHYVDAFSGSGRPKARDEDRYIKGSPRIALDLDPPFDTYTLIELKAWRAAKLRELRDEYPNRRIRIIEGDCNDVIRHEITPNIRSERKSRGFVWLDPFGTQLDWRTIADIAETGALETIINFPTMACNRAGLPRDPDALTPQHKRVMNRVWGDETWYDLLYEERHGLWGTHVVKTAPTGALRLGQLFKEHRLSKVFRHVTEPLVIRNSRHAPIYCLIFAGHYAVGAKIATEVFRRPDLSLPVRYGVQIPDPVVAQPALF